MSDVNDAEDGEFEAAHSELNRGLKSCRSVVSNYRALLSSNDNRMDEQGNDSGEGRSPAQG